MPVTVSLINMKGGVGKTTLAFNLAQYCACKKNLGVLLVDLDPQANLSQYCLGGADYLSLLRGNGNTVAEIFEESSFIFSNPRSVINSIKLNYSCNGFLHLIPSKLELAKILRNQKNDEFLSTFLGKNTSRYNLVIIDCAPTESILTTAAYQASKYVFVPVKPEFLATIGLPLLARSLNDFRNENPSQLIEMGGIIFNDMIRKDTPNEQIDSCEDVKRLAGTYGWRIFENVVCHSNSYSAGSRNKMPVFLTERARTLVKNEFYVVAEEFLRSINLTR